MINRTFICRLPNAGGVNLDIAVQNAPGSRSAPVGSGGSAASAVNGAYYELRGRSMRFPQPALVGGAPNPAFVPRANLGWSLSCYVWGELTAEVPGIILSSSIVNTLASTESGGPIINPPSLPDPSYGPTIRVLNNANTINRIAIVHFSIFENKDEDRDTSSAI